MYALVSTPGFLICHDIGSSKSEILQSGRGGYYGITWNPDGTELVLSHSGLDEESLIDLATYATSEQGYLTIGGQKTWQFLSAPHQILWVDDMVVVTNTGRNTLAKVNPRDHSIIQRRYDENLWDRLSATTNDGAHFNSLYHYGDSLYAVAHNFNKGSYILELDWPTLEEKGRRPVLNATGVHNLWIDEAGRFVVCDSNNGALIDANSSDVLWSNHGEGYIRGLAATEQSIIIGHSERSSRAGRRVCETGMWVLDRNDFRTIDYQYLGNFGAVQEVRIIDEPDLCHHGKRLRADALDGLRAKSRQVSETKLVRVRAAQVLADGWRSVLGKPRVIDAHTFAPEDDQLLLCISKTLGAEINGSLFWRVGTGTAHASLVVNYQGPEDQNMAAALFEQSIGGELVASIWINDGEWKKLCDRRIPSDAIRSKDGTSQHIQIGFRRVGQHLDLQLWEKPFLSALAGHLPDGGRVGVRLLGDLFEFHDVDCR